MGCCRIAVVRYMLSSPSSPSPFFAIDLRLSEFAARCSLYTAQIFLMRAFYQGPRRPCGLFIPARGVLFASQHLSHLLTDARRSLQPAYYSHHSTLIASHTLFLDAHRSLLEICCFLLADCFALNSSCFSLLFVSHSVLVSLTLLLADCCFFN